MWNNQNQGGGGFGDQGGGYVNSPGNFNSPQGSQPQKSNRQRAQNIIPCTIAQVLTATHTDDRFMINDIELHQVTIVGLVRTVKQTPTRMDYEIDDMTGPCIEIRQFIDSDDNAADTTQVMRENTYVRVYGHIRSFANKRSIVAFKMAPIMDMNELTSHLLETIKASMMLKKGQTTGANTSSMGVSGMDMSNQAGAGAYPGAQGDDGMGGLTPTQKQVSLVIRGVDSEQGVSVAEICRQLRGVPEKAIRDAIDFLSGEGHIYSTIDDEHYRSTDAL